MMQMYKLIPHDTKINFVGMRKITYFIALCAVILSVVMAFVRGFNFGIDFRGGFVMEIRTQQTADIGAMREKLNKLDIGDVFIQQFGSDRDLLIRIPTHGTDEKEQAKTLDKVKAALGDNVEYRKLERIGPKVGKELVDSAIYAVLISLGAILIYIWFRFEWQFALCGVIALAHDCIVLMGLYAIAHYFEFGINAIVALLMTACYSIHDTVVLFDRVRENMNDYRTLTVVELLNKSMNETLSRSVLTSVTTVLSLMALCGFGGKVIFDFCFPLLFGLVIGTFSSIFLAAPLLLITGIRVDSKDVPLGLDKI